MIYHKKSADLVTGAFLRRVEFLVEVTTLFTLGGTSEEMSTGITLRFFCLSSAGSYQVNGIPEWLFLMNSENKRRYLGYYLLFALFVFV